MNLSPEMRTYLKYAAAALTAFLAGAMAYTIPLLMDPTEPPISLRLLLGNGLTALMAAGISSRISRPGSERIASQVNALHNIAGVSKDEMIVVPSLDAQVSTADAVDANPRAAEVLPSAGSTVYDERTNAGGISRG